jgi:hypothetical protein
LYTIHGSKGLEFDIVFILNFHTNTYGMSPTKDLYNNFGYLWFTGLSRPRDELIIYSDSDKNIWHGLNYCDKNTYNISGNEITFKEPKFKDVPFRSSSITELLRTKSIFSEDHLLELKNMLNFEITEEKIYDEFKLPDYEKIGASLKRSGDFATKHCHRLTFHPGPFNKLTSSEQRVINNN